MKDQKNCKQNQKAYQLRICFSIQYYQNGVQFTSLSHYRTLKMK
jgi:hypothetical protein